MFRGSIRVVKI